MTQDHQLAMEYIARLLRRNVAANGPVLRHEHELDRFVRKDAAREFQSLLYPVGDFPTPLASAPRYA